MKIHKFFKEEDKQFAELFVKEGSIRLMPFSYYRRIEDKIRNDSNDGKMVWHPEGNEHSLWINDKKINYQPGLKIEHRNKDDEYWAICCFSRSSSLTKFGDICVTIHDRSQLVNRIRTFLGIENDQDLVYGDVFYYDHKTSHKPTEHMFLHKTLDYAQEEEFRVCINLKQTLQSNNIKELKFVNIDLGNLEDIASI